MARTLKPGALKAFAERMNRDVDTAITYTRDDPQYEVRDDIDNPSMLLVPLDGEPYLKARISRSNYGFVTRYRDRMADPGLTRNRWWRDEDGMVRAYCRWDRGTQWETEGVLVVAMLNEMRDGDTIAMADPLNLSRNVKVQRARRAA